MTGRAPTDYEQLYITRRVDTTYWIESRVWEGRYSGQWSTRTMTLTNHGESLVGGYDNYLLNNLQEVWPKYIGETGQLLHRMINGHRYNITHRNTEESPVALQFNGEGHILADMTVMAIDKIYSHHSCLCKVRESRWIRTLGTSWTSGLIPCETCSMTIIKNLEDLLCPYSNKARRKLLFLNN